ncbi:hypothetical protein ANO11243_022760 [Dothideomycetidae sp. 11243]|nr:hypothetical protein ANO11243_022760 [fungal sp. No.11243]
MARGNQRDKAREKNQKEAAKAVTTHTTQKSKNSMTGTEFAKAKEDAAAIMRAKQAAGQHTQPTPRRLQKGRRSDPWVNRGAIEPTEVKKRTKVAVLEPTIAEMPAENADTALVGNKKDTSKTTKPAKTPKPVKEVKSSIKDDFAGFSDSESETQEIAADHTNALLAGFSSDSESDGEQVAAVTKIPALPESADLKAELASAAVNPDSVPGTIYVGRVPHGFYEPQMRAYFSQFGTISRLRLSRNKLTGKSKHYAYIEFESSSVAEIAAKTMDKYLMFGHILQVRRLLPEEIHPELFKGANRRFKAMPRNRLERGQLERPRGREVWEKRVKNEEKRRRSKAEKLKEMGYEFEMPTVRKVSSVPKKPEDKVIVEAELPEIADAQQTEEQSEIADVSSAAIEDPSQTGEQDVAGEKRKKGRKEKKGTKKARLST